MAPLHRRKCGRAQGEIDSEHHSGGSEPQLRSFAATGGLCLLRTLSRNLPVIDRRELLWGAAVGTAIMSSSSASACSYMQYEDDEWGSKLIKYLKRGKTKDLDGLFQDFSSLVVFDPR